jgi:hypothetical protein
MEVEHAPIVVGDGKKKKKKSGKKLSKAEREAKKFANLSLQFIEKISETELGNILVPLLVDGKYDEAESKANEHCIIADNPSDNSGDSKFKKAGFYSGGTMFLDLLARNMMIGDDADKVAQTTMKAENAAAAGSDDTISIRPRTLIHYAVRFSQKMVWSRSPNDSNLASVVQETVDCAEDMESGASPSMNHESDITNHVNEVYSDIISEVLLLPLLRDKHFEAVSYLVSSFKSDEIAARFPLVRIAIDTLEYYNSLSTTQYEVPEYLEDEEVDVNNDESEAVQSGEGRAGKQEPNIYLSMMNNNNDYVDDTEVAGSGGGAGDVSVDASSAMNSEAEMLNAEGERVVRRMISYDSDGKLRVILF